VLNGVGVVWGRFFEEVLEVVCGRSCLALIATSLIDDSAIISCGLLVALFAPLLAGPGTHLGALDGDVGRRFPAAT
jgi:hypothetical protein